jgi:arsenate reductase
MMTLVKRVLFVCVRNSGRSQMARAFFNAITSDTAVADSAGTQPAEQVNPVVAQVMREVGFEIAGQKPKMLTLEMMEAADRVISMGCGVQESCPASMVPMEDWGIDDPEGRPVEDVRRIRDEIRKRVEKLVNDIIGKS